MVSKNVGTVMLANRRCRRIATTTNILLLRPRLQLLRRRGRRPLLVLLGLLLLYTAYCTNWHRQSHVRLNGTQAEQYGEKQHQSQENQTATLSTEYRKSIQHYARRTFF